MLLDATCMKATPSEARRTRTVVDVSEGGAWELRGELDCAELQRSRCSPLYFHACKASEGRAVRRPPVPQSLRAHAIEEKARITSVVA